MDNSAAMPKCNDMVIHLFKNKVYMVKGIHSLNSNKLHKLIKTSSDKTSMGITQK